MYLDNENRDKIRTLVIGYTDLLALLVRQTKPPRGERSELHEYYFRLFGELLCLREEHSAFLRNGLNENELSILDTPALLNYEELYAFLASDTEYPSHLLKTGDDEPIRLCEASVSICRRGLHCFGTKNVLGEDIESTSWSTITEKYFPCVSPVELRQAYYKYISSSDGLTQARIPERWTLEEDYAVFENVSRFGRGDLGVQAIYAALAGRRSYDEIVERIHVIYPNKTVEYKTKKRRPHEPTRFSEMCDSPRSDWSIDDSLLLVKE